MSLQIGYYHSLSAEAYLYTLAITMHLGPFNVEVNNLNSIMLIQDPRVFMGELHQTLVTTLEIAHSILQNAPKTRLAISDDTNALGTIFGLNHEGFFFFYGFTVLLGAGRIK